MGHCCRGGLSTWLAPALCWNWCCQKALVADPFVVMARGLRRAEPSFAGLQRLDPKSVRRMSQLCSRRISVQVVMHSPSSSEQVVMHSK